MPRILATRGKDNISNINESKVQFYTTSGDKGFLTTKRTDNDITNATKSNFWMNTERNQTTTSRSNQVVKGTHLELIDTMESE